MSPWFTSKMFRFITQKSHTTTALVYLKKKQIHHPEVTHKSKSLWHLDLKNGSVVWPLDPSLLENLQDISLKAACADSFYYPQVPREGKGGMESGQGDINCKGGKLQTRINFDVSFYGKAGDVFNSCFLFVKFECSWTFFIAPNGWFRLKKYPQLVLQFMMHRNLWKHLIIWGNPSKKLTKKNTTGT